MKFCQYTQRASTPTSATTQRTIQQKMTNGPRGPTIRSQDGNESANVEQLRRNGVAEITVPQSRSSGQPVDAASIAGRDSRQVLRTTIQQFSDRPHSIGKAIRLVR